MIIFGIDPGIAVIGYCALKLDSQSNVSVITWGSIQTDKHQPLAARLLEIHKDLKYLLTDINPDVIALEELYYFKNAKTVIPVMQARGVILMTAEMCEIEVYGYSPIVVKKVITGYGRASKSEVKDLLTATLDLKNVPKLDDVVDAAAIAYCHVRHL